MTDRYAVIGNPIAQSKSPQIHLRFAEQTGQDIDYSRLEFPVDGFEAGIAEFINSGGKGANVTAPFKQDAYEFVHQTTKRARRAGAVNTISVAENGNIIGDTSDGVGLLRDIVDNLKWSVSRKKVLILGSGGAVRGILDPLIEQAPEVILIANRTASKARSLATAFSGEVSVVGTGLEELTQGAQAFDLVLNGTSSSLSGDGLNLPTNLITSDSCCYDLMYGPAAIPFMQWAEQQGARAADGLGMLVEQAAESFRIWREVMPETAPVIDELRDMLSS